MTSSKTCLLAAVASVLTTGAAWADNSDLQQQVNDLKGQVSQLQAKQAAGSKEVAATIESVLRDAEKRSTMLAAGESGAGYDNGFFIRSGAFSLQPGILFQFWNNTDYRSNTAGSKDDEIENGFEVHRLELSLQGTAFTKDLTYMFMWNTNSDEGGGLTLLDAYATYFFSDQWGFKAGQYNSPFAKENIMSDGTQLAAERSLLNAALSGYTGRVQGLSLVYGDKNDKNPIAAEVAFTDGSGSQNSNYVGHYPGDPGTVGNHAFDFGVAGRVDWKASGSWKNTNDFSAINIKDNLFVLGGAFAWDQGGNGDVIGLTVDAMFKTGNIGLYGALVWRHTTSELTGTDDVNDWGGLVQASYAFNPAWELFGRFSYLQYDNALVKSTDSEDTFMEVTVGVNYYLGNNGSAGHRAKVTVDLNWLPNGAPATMTGTGYLGDNNFDTEITIRGQFQLML